MDYIFHPGWFLECFNIVLRYMFCMLLVLFCRFQSRLLALVLKPVSYCFSDFMKVRKKTWPQQRELRQLRPFPHSILSEP